MRMLNDLHPNESAYYLGYIILKVLKEKGFVSLESLFDDVNTHTRVRFSGFVLALDWLFCSNAIDLDSKGLIELCI